MCALSLEVRMSVCVGVGYSSELPSQIFFWQEHDVSVDVYRKLGT